MTLIKGGRLLHQYIVDIYTAIEEDRLRWARNNQDILRAELYGNVLDDVCKSDTDARIIGQRSKVYNVQHINQEWYNHIIKDKHKDLCCYDK